MDRTPTPPNAEEASERGLIVISPRLSPTPPEPTPGDDDERQHEAELLWASLANGETSRSRRLGPSRRSQSRLDLSQPSSAIDNDYDEPEVSPEEIRAARIAELARSQEEERESFENDLQALNELRRFRSELRDLERDLTDTGDQTFSLVRKNDPIPIPRLSSLPRGGRHLPTPQIPTPSSTSSTNANDLVSTFRSWTSDLQLPPPSLPSSSSPSQVFSPPPVSSSTNRIPRTTSSSSFDLPSFETLFARIAATNSSNTTQEDSNNTARVGGGGMEGIGGELRSYFLEPTHLVGESFSNEDEDAADHEAPEPVGEQSSRSGPDSLLDRFEAQAIREGFNLNDAGGGPPSRPVSAYTGTRARWTIVTNPFGDVTVRSLDADPDVEEEDEGNQYVQVPNPNSRGETERVISRNSRITANQQRQGSSTGETGRSREETNSLSGRALRSKKGVYLLYCGGTESTSSEGESLPRGFERVDGGKEAKPRGCGALICARGLIEGIPKKVFADDKKEELEAFSSDLPPSTIGLADLEDEEEGLGERVGKRGWKGCKGCITRDLGCRRCGNHVGYRLLRPDVYCSIARDSSSSGSSHGPWRRLTESNRIGGGSGGGGVTGGGVVDGLLFHFRNDRTTAVRRRVGMLPQQQLQDERNELAAQSEHGDVTEAKEGEGKEARLTEKVPKMGDEMIWKHIPPPQRDFRDGLISEPLEWLTPNQETWWLDNSIFKHSYSLNGTRYGSRQSRLGRKRTAEEMELHHSTDNLSSATTTVNNDSSRPRSGSGASLNRSRAIRLTIPLASSSSPNSNSSVANYDRYRSDAQQYARRVRQRLDNNDLSSAVVGSEEEAAGAGLGVVASLERAGYGSWFDEEEEDVEETSAVSKRSKGGRARQSVGR
ncbi:uncharacterized protein JCM6883_001401 [Sporobolomyces salmoneus]|uniref:uncharacterized protein n=1 Tax=Sporobolomyces salmoneus TaxID=183962 RepID=UPI00316F34A8